jgi:hypothetical protein
MSFNAQSNRKANALLPILVVGDTGTVAGRQARVIAIGDDKAILIDGNDHGQRMPIPGGPCYTGKQVRVSTSRKFWSR